MVGNSSRGNIYHGHVLAKILVRFFNAETLRGAKQWRPTAAVHSFHFQRQAGEADIRAMVVDNCMFSETTASQLISIYSFIMKTNLPAAVSWTPIGSDKCVCEVFAKMNQNIFVRQWVRLRDWRVHLQMLIINAFLHSYAVSNDSHVCPLP